MQVGCALHESAALHRRGGVGASACGRVGGPLTEELRNWRLCRSWQQSVLVCYASVAELTQHVLSMRSLASKAATRSTMQAVHTGTVSPRLTALARETVRASPLHWIECCPALRRKRPFQSVDYLHGPKCMPHQSARMTSVG